MVQLKTNHSRGSGGGIILRIGLFTAILSVMVYFFNQFISKVNTTARFTDKPVAMLDIKAFDFLPTSSTGDVVYNPYFVLSYAEEHEQAEWVAYQLTAERLNMPWVKRSDAFLPDPSIRTKSATPDDYRGSGYDRGHLASAADMAFSEDAMQYTFLMSNISPQVRNFNQGIWRELEELTRNWAKDNEALYIVTGPVLSETSKGTIGGNKVSVPVAYYKVILDNIGPERKGIAFVIPNEVSYEPLFKYATSIDAVEKRTNIDFFHKFLSATDERALEGAFNVDLWKFSKKKYELRTKKWNQDGGM